LVLDFSVFAPNNSLATKIKNLNEYVAENWTPIFGLFDFYTQ